MRYFLGIDGGATKVETIIIDEQQKLVTSALGEPVNYHQGGQKQTKQNLEGVIKKILTTTNLKIEDIAFAVLGLAGMDTEEDERTLNRLAQNLLAGSLEKKVKVVSDVEIAFAASVTKDYGEVLISGTGANCFGKGKKGQVARAGNWGYLLGDQASGFALGLGALERIMRALDGRGEKTVLTKLILDELQLERSNQLARWIYQKEVPVKEIAHLAPLVFKAYNQEDRVAQELIKKLISEMVLNIKTVAIKTGLIGEKFEIGLVGGIFKEKLVVRLLNRELGKIMPRTKLVLPKISPSMAAAIMALQDYFKRLSL